jgi:hypothetical protein
MIDLVTRTCVRHLRPNAKQSSTPKKTATSTILPFSDWRSRNSSDSDTSDDKVDYILPSYKEQYKKPIGSTVDLDDTPRDQAAVPSPYEPWNPTQELIRSRQPAQKITEEWADANLNLKNRGKRKRYVRDRATYREGMEDSKKMDLKRRRIEENKDGDN